MRALISLTTALAASAALMGFGAAAAQAAGKDTTSTFSTRGDYASVYGSSSNGCIFRDFGVSGYAGATRTGGSGSKRPLGQASIGVWTYSYDSCNDVYLEGSWGWLDSASLTQLNGTKGARLKGVVQTYDWVSESSGEVAVDVTLTGTGKVSTSRYSYRSGGFSDSGTGRYRNASATGSILVGGANLLDGATLSATLGHNTSRSSGFTCCYAEAGPVAA